MTTTLSDRVPESAESTVIVSRTRRRWLGPGIVAVGAITWATLFSVLSIARHEHYLTNAFDMGQMIQALWKIHHGQGGFSTVTGLSILGDHARFITYVAAWLPTSIRLMVVLQAAALASGAVPVFLMARRRAPGGWAAVLAFLYLLYPALQWMTLFDFHPEILATPLLLWALWAIDGPEWVYWVTLGVAIACREDVALVVVVMGTVLILERRRRQGALTLALGAAALVLTTSIMTAHNPYGLSVFQERYGWIGSGPIDALRNMVLHTPTVLRRARALNLPLSDALMLAGYLAPMPFVIFARRTRVWSPAPVLLAHALSNVPQQRSIYFQYGYLVVPLVFFAASDGIARLASWRVRTKLIVGVLSAAVILAGTPAFSPFIWSGYRGPEAFPKPGPIFWQLAKQQPMGYDREANAALGFIPDEVPVSASGNLLPHVAKRTFIYMFPNPFYVVWYGRYLTQHEPPGAVPTMPADPPPWVIVDSANIGPDSPAIRQEALALLRTRYVPVFQGQWISVWRLI